MENTLFNQHRMDKYAKDKSFKLNLSSHDLIKEHIEKLEKGELKAETSNYLYFFDVFLRDILGYDRKENVLFDETVDKGAKRSEFVLANADEKFMIVELKGQYIDLDKPQQGHGGKTPVKQAMDYSYDTNSANWVMVSNYDEFRLYNYHEKTHYISFKVEELLDPKIFSYFMLSFSKKSHLKENYTDKLLKESLVVEEDIETDFYKLFHETRLMLIKELEDINGFDTPKAVHYAQAILNRYMFICFAEDINNLLPSEISTETIYVPIRENNISQRTIWNRLNELFGFINNGNKYKGVNRYNGGLFKESFDFITIRDIVEDPNYFKDQRQKWDLKKYSLKINDLMGPYGKKINPIYWNLLTISSINFESDLDVNILGHIFENSIGDLEDLKEGSKGRRKKDGIFYTPAYITEYICKNTIIPYLSKSGKPTEVKDLIGEYWGSDIHELDEKVRKIKIVDPACGSGAFLNKAADILVEIHEEIHKTLYKDDKTLAKFFDNVGERRKILKNNIYGVDLNEESVEITKLALFLKVAQKDSTLPDIDENIKCGNSLIDDPEFAAKKAFKWAEKFPKIFEDGGFDIIIGNPPYVDIKNINPKDVKFFFNHFKTAENRINLYSLFVELGLDILNKDGYFGFIIPNSILYNDSYSKIRKLLLKQVYLSNIVRLPDKIFPAWVETIIITFKKTHDTQRDVNIILYGKDDKIKKIGNLNTKSCKISQSNWNDGKDFIFRIFVDNNTLSLLSKIEGKYLKLGEISAFSLGITPYDKYKGHTKEQIANKVFHSTFQKDRTFKKLLAGNDVMRYYTHWNGKYWINYGSWLGAPRDQKFFIEKRILVKQIIDTTAKRIWASISDEELYNSQNAFNIIPAKGWAPEFILSILNSKLMTFYHRKKFLDETKSVYQKILIKNCKKFPIPQITLKEQKTFVDKVNQMNKLKISQKGEIREFRGWLKRTFEIEKLSQKIEKYYELSFDDFLNELKKKKVDIKPRKTQELLQSEFNQSVSVLNPLLQQIKETDKEIDEMVYDLYGLTPEEREIINNNLT